MEMNEIFLANYDYALTTYAEILEILPEAKDGLPIYPEYWGGIYIDEDGNLNLLIKENSIPEVGLPAFLVDCLESGRIIEWHVNYSYNELNNVINTLNQFKANRPDDEISKNFNLFYLSDKENIVIVELDDYNEENVQLFKTNVADTEMIKFVEKENDSVLDVNVNPGRPVYPNASTLPSSMGYRARRNGLNGFVSTAHGIPANATVRRSAGGPIIGTVTQRQWLNNGSLDAVFVQTNANHTPTNTFVENGNNVTVATSLYVPIVGTIVNQIGSSTGNTSGSVNSTNLSATFLNGVTINNLARANYRRAGGDSGGLVYTFIRPTNVRHTTGIHVGGTPTNGYYTRAALINNAFGLTRY